MVDLSTLALELNTTGMARGEREASAILDRLGQRIDKFISQADRIGKAVGSALNIGGGGSKVAQAFSQNQTQFQQHQARLEAIAKQSSARIQEIEARRLAQLDTIRERFAQAERARQNRINNQPTGALAFFRRYSSTLREAGESIQQFGYGLTALSAGLVNAGRTAVQSAVDIDRQVNVLKSLTGSAEAAERRFAELVATAQKTPGLTASLATTLDAQLRVADVTEKTINRILPAIGKLNAVSPLGDPQRFAQNLTQLVTQGFERTDLKELVGQSPLAGEIIKQLFSVDNATNAKAIRESAKKLGIDTTDEFFAAFAATAANNSKLAGVTESIGTQLEKLRDRVLVAFRPLGVAVLNALQPLIEKAVPIIERLSKAFAELPQGTQQAIILFGVLAAAVGPLVIAMGGLIQAFGAFGNIVTVVAGTLGAGSVGGAAGIGAALAGLAPIILPLGAAVATLGAAWATNFGKIRDLTADAVTEASAQFQELRAFWREIAPDLLAIIQPALEAVRIAFQLWGGYIGDIYRSAFEVIKVVTREAADVIGPLIRAALALMRGDFETFGQKVSAAWRETWDFIVTVPARAMLAIYDTVASGINRLLDITGIAQAVGSALGISIMTGIQDAITGLFPSTVASLNYLGGLADKARGYFGGRDKARDAQRTATEGRGLDGEEITTTDFAASKVAQDQAQQRRRTVSVTEGSSKADSAARQLRGAQETLDAARAKARLDIQEKLTRNILEIEKAAFEQRLISADDYFNRVIRRELELQNIEKRRIQGEAAASARRLNEAKDGSPEAIRELTQLVDLQARLRVIELDRPNILRKINGELEQAKKLEAERNREAIAQAALSGPGFVANQRIIADTDARGQLKLDQPQRELRREEQQLQAAANAGLIREEQLTDAVTLTRRKYREEIIASLEAKKRIAALDTKNAGRFGEIERINEEIDSIQLLGTELTRGERLRKRFAEQGVLDYSRVNEGVENLLAEQKGLTEIFSDFRANQVQGAFGLIETGVDKLTERMGVLGDAVGSLLKDLLKLAATSIFKKLFGLDSGAASQPGLAFAGGAPAAAGGGGLLGGLIPGLGGGGQQGGGGGILGSLFSGGGGGNFLTGGFAGGNPAQAALGGGGSPGGILGNILGGGQQSGGGLGGILGGGKLTGVLSKIPLLGKLFGGGASSIAPIIGGGGFGAGGAGLGAAGAAGGAGGLASLGALFTNPITAIIGGGILATYLGFKLFGNQDFKKFQKAVDSTYAVKIKGDKDGKSVFEQAKGIGEQAFGKGSFKNKIKETIALKDVKDLIAAYGEATGQENSALVKRATQVREIANVGNSANNFSRRAMGGPVSAYNAYIVGENRPEVFVPSTSGQIYPSVQNFAANYSPAAPNNRAAGSSAESTGLRIVVAQLAEMIGEFRAQLSTYKPDDIIRFASPSAVADAASQGFAQSTTATQNAQRALGVTQ